MPNQKLLSIKDASQFFKVTEKTIRRWEKRGLLIPLRTNGVHRRYQLSQLKEFKKNKTKIQIEVSDNYLKSPIDFKTPTIALSDNVEYPEVNKNLFTATTLDQRSGNLGTSRSSILSGRKINIPKFPLFSSFRDFKTQVIIFPLIIIGLAILASGLGFAGVIMAASAVNLGTADILVNIA